MNFYKMQGVGNDFVFIEDFNNEIKDECKLVEKFCDRYFGIGVDGLVIVRKLEVVQVKMVIINVDGLRVNMCGNVIRCFGKYVYEYNIVNSIKFFVEIGDGIKEIEIILEDVNVKYVKVYMGNLFYDGYDIFLNNLDSFIDIDIIVDNKIYRVIIVLMGVFYIVIFENDRDYDVIGEGLKVEKFYLFKEGSNINFVKIIDKIYIRVDMWERGVGVIFVCGIGCFVLVVVVKRLGFVEKDKEIYVKVLGGEFIIDV